MRPKRSKRLRSAYTLYELAIVLALFAVVAAMVSSFVAFMIRFNERSEQAYDRTEQLVALRKELDDWFSYTDGEALTFTSGPSGTSIRSGGSGGTASFSFSEGNAVFVYPSAQDGLTGAKTGTVTIVCPRVKQILVSAAETGGDAGESGEDELRFYVRRMISAEEYLCVVYYE